MSHAPAGRRGRTRRALIALGLIWGCGLIAAAGAPAASLVYLKGGDIWIASPNGAVQRQITTNGGSAGWRPGTETTSSTGSISTAARQAARGPPGTSPAAR